jgi:hypothetical protein
MQVGLRKIALAALRVSEGDLPAAEHALRELFSFGLVLVDHSTIPEDAIVGGSLGTKALDALEQLYAVTGQPKPAVGPRGAIAAENRRPTPTSLESSKAGVLDDTRVRAYRWQGVALLVPVFECRNLRALLSGPTDDERSFLDSVRGSLVSDETDGILFDIMSRQIERAALAPPVNDRTGSSAIRAAARVIRKPRLYGCVRSLDPL